MNSVEQKIQDLAPGYVLTDAQREAVDRADDPDRLPRQIDSLRDAMVEYAGRELPHLNLTPDDLPASLLMSEIRDFSKGGFAGSWFAVKDTAEGVSPAVWIEIARRKYDFIGNLYRDHLGRRPDSEGYNFWVKTWNKQFVDGIQ